jgi:hypothetical protein
MRVGGDGNGQKVETSGHDEAVEGSLNVPTQCQADAVVGNCPSGYVDQRLGMVPRDLGFLLKESSIVGQGLKDQLGLTLLHPNILAPDWARRKVSLNDPADWVALSLDQPS